MNQKPLALAGLVMLCGAAASYSATIIFRIVPIDLQPNSNGVFVVEPGDEIPFELTAEITSDGENPSVPDNSGLAYFSVTLATNFEVDQLPLDEFIPLVQQSFPITQSLGNPVEDDVEQIGGGQNTFSVNGTGGIAQGEEQVLGRGRLITPSRQLLFRAQIDADKTSANVFFFNNLQRVTQAQVAEDDGIIISTVLPQDDDDDGDGDGDGDDDDDDDDNGGPTTQPGIDLDIPEISVEQGAILAVGMLVTIIGAFALAGPFGAMLALVLAPLLVLSLMISGAIQ